MSDKKEGPSCANTTGPKSDFILNGKSESEHQATDTKSNLIQPREPFPIEAFPKSLREVALELAEVYNVPVCLPAISILAFLSGAVGKSYAVTDAYRDKVTFLNIYSILIVERGLGKGNIGGTLSKPILELEKELREDWVKGCAKAKADIEILKDKLRKEKAAASKDDLQARDAMINLQSDIDKAEAYLNSPPAILIDDTTSEALADRLSANYETLLSYSSEAGNLLKVAMGKYSDQGDFDLLLSAYSGDSYKSDRMGRGTLRLDNPRLAALWMVQRTVLNSLLKDRDAFDRGLTARFLVVNTEARRTKDDGEEKIFTKASQWATLLEPILKLRKNQNSESEPILIKCSGEAKEVFRMFHNESIDFEDGLWEGYHGECSRWRENAIKVAGLFQLVLDKDRMIDEKTARAACEVVRWCGQGYIRLLMKKRLEGLQDKAEKLVGICKEHGGEVSMGDLQSKHGRRNGQVNEVRMLVRTFPDLFSLETRPTSTKPREVLVAR